MKDLPVNIETLQDILSRFPHCKMLNMQIKKIEDKQLTVEMPYSEQIIGNPDSGVIHGGAITTLMDSSMGLSVPIGLGGYSSFAPTLDLRIDYMTAAKPNKSVFTRAETYRVTSNVIFTRGIAYQDDPDKPIAHAVASFMLLPAEVTKGSNIING